VTPAELIAELHHREARLDVRDGELHVGGRRGALTTELKAAISASKAAILDLLTAPDADTPDTATGVAPTEVGAISTANQTAFTVRSSHGAPVEALELSGPAPLPPGQGNRPDDHWKAVPRDERRRASGRFWPSTDDDGY
jgi:hypothetical protein